MIATLSGTSSRRASLYVLGTVLLGLAAGCASSSLKIDLALYRGDPSSAVGTTENDIAKIVNRTTTVVTRGRKLANDANSRIDTVEDVYKAYDIVFRARTKSERPGISEEELNDQLSSYVEIKNRYVIALQPLAIQLPPLLDKLDTALIRIRAAAEAFALDPALAKHTDDLEARKKELRLSFTAVQALLSLLDTDTPTNFISLLNVVAEDFKKWIAGTLGKKTGSVVGSPAVLDTEAQRKASVMREIKKAARILDGLAKRSGIYLSPTTPDVMDVGTAMAKILESLGAKNQESDILAREIVSDTLFRSMQEFESLHNAADPRWRVVRDPRNASKWIEQKSQVAFYSEGNNSVVVVRDRPDDFRVQSGSNNPTQLVRSQLEISRAVGSAAIAIGGAALGSHKLGLGQSGRPAGTAPSDDGIADSEKLAADIARTSEESRLRRVMLDDLRTSSRRLEEELDAAGADLAKLSVVKDKLNALLGAAVTMLPSPPPPTPTSPVSPTPTPDPTPTVPSVPVPPP